MSGRLLLSTLYKQEEDMTVEWLNIPQPLFPKLFSLLLFAGSPLPNMVTWPIVVSFRSYLIPFKHGWQAGVPVGSASRLERDRCVRRTWWGRSGRLTNSIWMALYWQWFTSSHQNWRKSVHLTGDRNHSVSSGAQTHLLDRRVCALKWRGSSYIINNKTHSKQQASPCIYTQTSPGFVRNLLQDHCKYVMLAFILFLLPVDTIGRRPHAVLAFNTCDLLPPYPFCVLCLALWPFQTFLMDIPIPI